mmetsp:Transcript_40527/g.91211  ORF Transcript_40527/g.91211 Transcript_40527/m.91211 type:complete len:269 (-) Transcript_40527:372-1178(-)
MVPSSWCFVHQDSQASRTGQKRLAPTLCGKLVDVNGDWLPKLGATTAHNHQRHHQAKTHHKKQEDCNGTWGARWACPFPTPPVVGCPATAKTPENAGDHLSKAFSTPFALRNIGCQSFVQRCVLLWRCAFVGCAGHHCLQSQGPSHSTNLEQLGSAATSKHAPSKSSTQKPGQLTRVSRQCEKHNGALPLPSTLVSSACRTVQAGNAEAHCKDMYARKHLPYSMSDECPTLAAYSSGNADARAPSAASASSARAKSTAETGCETAPTH